MFSTVKTNHPAHLRTPKTSAPLKESPEVCASARSLSDNSSSPSHSQDGLQTPIFLPRAAYQRPESYGQRPSTSCTHCGSIAPRFGSTTIYGTPLEHTPATSIEVLDKFSNCYSSSVSFFCVKPLVNSARGEVAFG